MHERVAIVRRLRQVKNAPRPTSAQKKAEAFLDVIRQKKEACWPELVKEFREDYYDCFEDIIPRLVETDDPQVMMLLVEYADLQQKKEVETLLNFVKKCDPGKHGGFLTMLSERRLPAELKRAVEAKMQEAERIEQVPVFDEAMKRIIG